MVDQRFDQRRQHGNLTVIAGGSISCTLVDVSRSGARLTTDRILPDKFYVIFPNNLKRWCQVVWRRRAEIGVRFIADPTRRR